MFFLITIFELMLLISGFSMFLHHRIVVGGTLIFVAVILFMVTSVGYAGRRRSTGLCGDMECGFLEGFACAECIDGGLGGGDCIDCGVTDCGN